MSTQLSPVPVNPLGQSRHRYSPAPPAFTQVTPSVHGPGSVIHGPSPRQTKRQKYNVH